MDIKNKTLLVLGGWGLVGNALTRKLVKEKPKRIIVTSLRKEEAEEHVAQLKSDYPNFDENFFIPWWGNIFVRNSFKDTDRYELLNSRDTRLTLISDTMEEMNSEILHESSIYKLIEKYKPDIIIDSINAATGIAYQDVYTTYRTIKKTIENNPKINEVIELTEKLLSTQYIPQLIRHIQLLYASMEKFETEVYLKVGLAAQAEWD